MGAWGVNAFENDNACDWAYGLEVGGPSFVHRSLEAVLECGDRSVDAAIATEALAACEVIARLRGNWGIRSAYTKRMDDWVLSHPQVVPVSTVEAAVTTIDRIARPPSELADLWKGPRFHEWDASLADLRARVCGPRVE